jgi:hypothetical protein
MLMMHFSQITGPNCWFRKAVLAFIVLFVMGLNGSLGFAAPQTDANDTDDEKNPIKLIAEGNRPLLTITFASANRFMDEARYIFDVAGTPEAFKVVEEFVSGTLNNLDGFNRDKPFGIMAYLPVAIPPMPEFIAFVPVDSVEAATKLIEKAPVVIRKETEEGRYSCRLATPRRKKRWTGIFPIRHSCWPDRLSSLMCRFDWMWNQSLLPHGRC